MKYLITSLFFVLSFSAFGQYGYFKPKYIGWPIDSSEYQSLIWDPVLDYTRWGTVSGGVNDSTFVDGDSICVISVGDTVCVSQDSFYILNDSLCIISVGDTICVPYSSAGVNIYNANGTLTSTRFAFLNNFGLTFDYGAGSTGTFSLRPNVPPFVAIDGGNQVLNDDSPLLSLSHSGGGDMFMHFNGTANNDFSLGLDKDDGAFAISEAENLSNPFMQYYGVGDSLVFQNNSLIGGAGVRIRSHNTAAPTGDLQKLLHVYLSGANASGARTTYAGFFNNSHTGSSPINYGVWATTSSTLGASISGNNTGAGIAIEGVSNTGIGITGTSATNIGVYGISNSALNNYYGVKADIYSSNTSNYQAALGLFSRSTGTPINGIGTGIDMFVQTATGGDALASNSIKSTWIDATTATRTSQLMFTGVNSAAIGNIVSFEGNKRVLHYGRHEKAQGADVASAAGAIALGLDGNTFEITGTSAITLISNLNWQNGSEVTLIFTSTATLTDGTANSGTDIGMELAGNSNFGATADDVLTLVLCEISGLQRWREKSRTAN